MIYQPDSTKDLPFDQYQRYRLVADLVGRLQRGNGPLRVLDVGGRTALLRRFLPDHEVVLVDSEPADEAGLVLGDGSALPFADDTFDVVCALDTLEHVPPDRRRSFVAECVRLARTHVVLAGPFHEQRVVEAEELLQGFLEKRLGVSHRYLREHRSLGLPARDEIERELRSLGAEVRSTGHGRLERWLLCMCLGLYLDHDPALQWLAAGFHRFFNEEIHLTDRGGAVYRHVVVAAFGGARLPADELAAEEQPNSLDIGKLVRFAAEMRLLERARESWAEERAGWVGSQEAWLEDRRQMLEVMNRLRREALEHADTTRILRADLTRHRRTGTALEGRLRGLDDALHEACDRHAQAGEALERKLAEVEGVACGLQGELRDSLQEAQRLGRLLKERDRRVGELTRRLRSRWGNLRRLLSWRKAGSGDRASGGGSFAREAPDLSA